VLVLADGERPHIGEHNAEPGRVHVLTDGHPAQIRAALPPVRAAPQRITAEVGQTATGTPTSVVTPGKRTSVRLPQIICPAWGSPRCCAARQPHESHPPATRAAHACEVRRGGTADVVFRTLGRRQPLPPRASEIQRLTPRFPHWLDAC